MGGGGSKPDDKPQPQQQAIVPAAASSSSSSNRGNGGGQAAFQPSSSGGGASSGGNGSLADFQMDDEVAQQTADLLFDLLPYYGTGNAEADQIFLATLQANDILAHSRDAHGNTLLMIACQASKQDIINLMIEKDVDVNAQNYMGVTALHIGKTFFYLFAVFPIDHNQNKGKILFAPPVVDEGGGTSNTTLTILVPY